MTKQMKRETTQNGDLVQLLGSNHKSHFIKLKEGEVFQTHRGVIKHDDLIGQEWGKKLYSHQGNPFYVMQPGLADILRETKRTTQIMYPKDIGYILLVMGIGPGSMVLEAGTGSGALTCAFAYMVGDNGHVYSYDRRPEIQKIAEGNVTRLDLDNRVTFKTGDAVDGFSEKNLDALFLDLPNPQDYLEQVKASLKPGGFFGTIVPTTNQVATIIESLKKKQFAFIEVCELLLRFYKADWERLRPTDRMVAHTGYLVFGRSVLEDVMEGEIDLPSLPEPDL